MGRRIFYVPQNFHFLKIQYLSFQMTCRTFLYDFKRKKKRLVYEKKAKKITLRSFLTGASLDTFWPCLSSQSSADGVKMTYFDAFRHFTNFQSTTLLRIAVLGLSQNPRFTQFFLKNSKINCFMTLNVYGKLLGVNETFWSA